MAMRMQNITFGRRNITFGQGYTPFGLSSSKPSALSKRPFDKLRANGMGMGMRTQNIPFGLSLSKPPAPSKRPFDKLRANGIGMQTHRSGTG